MNKEFGFVRVGVGSPRVKVANPLYNAEQTVKLAREMAHCDIIVMPELGVTAYSCRNLFSQELLIHTAQEQVLRIAKELDRADNRMAYQLIFVGCPVYHNNNLYNCAVALNAGRIIGVVPKQFLPNYREFEESRWFHAGNLKDSGDVFWTDGEEYPFGVDLLFNCGDNVIVGAEICEDLWMPVPPSSYQAMSGATILVNLSASNETVAKADYRKELVVGQSGRCVAAVAYASCGLGESTTDIVFGGDCLIAENGSLLARSKRLGDGSPVSLDGHCVYADVDVKKLMYDRRLTTSFGDQVIPFPFRKIDVLLEGSSAWYDILSDEPKTETKLFRPVNAHPFVPSDPARLKERCTEVFAYQVGGLLKRIDHIGATNPIIGVSGGLDSTLALLALVKTYRALGRDPEGIRGVTMPGFGTSDRTLGNSMKLMAQLGVTASTIDICQLCLDMFRQMNYHPFGINPNVEMKEFKDALRKVPKEKRKDLTFENTQARMRTSLLMNQGFVIGTGDLTEAALGWCTYNADHMSMYNPNTTVPKTLVRFLVKYAAENEFEGDVRDTLLDIYATEISPELLPADEKGVGQSTEGTIGPFEVHDFILFNLIRNGYPPKKILFLAKLAGFEKKYDEAALWEQIKVFHERFFRNQFKRSAAPDGPKVGSVGLSQRGDWRMASDADSSLWMQ